MSALTDIRRNTDGILPPKRRYLLKINISEGLAARRTAVYLKGQDMSFGARHFWRIAASFAMVLSFFAGAHVFAVGETAAQPGKTINLQIIVDQSGSMAAETDTGVLRIDAAKTVLNEVISQIPEEEGVNVGFRVYGHLGNNQPEGQAESCVSSDLLVPMQGVDKAALTEQVNALVPVGWTPLGYALEQAAADFTQPASEDVVNAIIMVTDGLETCDADPAAIAGDLRNSEAGITTHVIGFGTNPEELAILEGITQASGGQLLDSNNAGQLMDALFQILEALEVVEETGSGLERDSPLGVGRIGRVGDYDISVISVVPSVPEAHNIMHYDEPLPTGDQFFMARISVTYQGAGSGLADEDLEFFAVGQQGKSYGGLGTTCSTNNYERELLYATEIFQGGTAEYDLCWQINNADADSLVMYARVRNDRAMDPIWFSLGNPIEIVAEPGATPVPDTFATPTETANVLDSDSGEVTTQSSREDPVPLGNTGVFNDFQIRVTGTVPHEPDAYNVMHYDESLPAGDQYFVATISVTYVGTGSIMVNDELEFLSIGQQGKTYGGLGTTCTTNDYERELLYATEIFSGGTAEYDLCWQINQSDQENLTLIVKERHGSSDHSSWFALTDTPVQVPDETDSDSTSTQSQDANAAIVITDSGFEPLQVTVPANSQVVLTMTNNGTASCNLVVEHLVPIDLGVLEPSTEATIETTFSPGRIPFYCSGPADTGGGHTGIIISE